MPSCPVNLLSDEPSRKDLFGPHQRVAQAIAQMVQSERGGKAVALEGTWGSGKSTTVQLLRKELAPASDSKVLNNSVFVFDAWAHRGDPLRRSFIEELADHLNQVGWIKKEQEDVEEDWQSRLDQLAERQEDSTITSQPGLQDLGKLLVILTAAVPIGLALYSIDSVGVYGRILGGFLAAGPALLAAYVVLFRQTEEGHVLGLFINEIQKKVESTKTRTPDPTSIEFRALFTDLLDDAIGEGNRRLIIAIDNLDRVDADEALTIWSTMRTFFEFRAGRSYEWLERFWLLVPYDKHSLRRLWQVELEEASKGDSRSQSTSGDPADAFIEKSFQVRFRVSPPVMSDWRDYFTSKLETALPEHTDEEEQYTVYQIYNHAKERDETGITPRDIVLFINQLGALHRQWGEEIPIEAQALFAAFRDDIKGKKDLATGQFIPDRLLRLIGSAEFSRHMAALYFNVTPEKALQVLMGDSIEEALVEGSGEVLKENYVQVPGFEDVLMNRLASSLPKWAASDRNGLARASTTISELTNDLRPAVVRQAWRSVRRHVRNIEEWPSFNDDTSKGLLRIIENSSSSERNVLEEKVISAVLASCPTQGDENGTEGDTADWVTGVANLISGLEADAEWLRDVFRVPGGAPSYLEVVRELHVQGISEEVATEFVPEASGDELLEALKTRVAEQSVQEEILQDIRFLNELEVDIDWDQLGIAVAQSLRTNNDLDPASLLPLCILFEQLALWGTVPGEHLPQQVRDGHLHHRIWEANKSGSKRAVAACVLPILIHHPGGSLRRSSGSQSGSGQNIYNRLREKPEDNKETVDELAELVADCGVETRMLTENQYRQEAPNLTAAILRNILQSKLVTERIEPEQVIEHYSFLKTSVLNEKSRSGLLATYGRRTDLHRKLAKLEVNEETAPLHIEALRATGGQDAVDEYVRHLVNRLGAIAEEVWTAQLKSEGVLLTLLRELLDLDRKFAISTELSKGLRNHLRAILEGEDMPSDPSDWDELLGALESHTREVFLDRVVKELGYAGGGYKHRGILLYGQILASHEDVLRRNASDVVSSLLPDLIDEMDVEGLEWIREVLESRRKVWERASDDAKRYLQDEVSSALQRTDREESAYEYIADIAYYIGVEQEGHGNLDEK